jgi:WD40 repeat protein
LQPLLVLQAEGSGRKERFVLSVAFSPDRQLLAAGAMDGTVAVWDVAAGGQLLHIGGLKGHHKPVRSLAFTPGVFAFFRTNKLTLFLCFQQARAT